MPNARVIALALALAVGCQSMPTGTDVHAGKPEALAAVCLPLPPRDADARYLGVPEGVSTFAFKDVQAQVLVIWVFDMYCPTCQQLAPQVGKVYDLLRTRGYGDRIKMIGIGAGNSTFEAAKFKSALGVRFPVFADADRAVSDGVSGGVFPYLLALRLGGEKGLMVFYGRETDSVQPEAFVDILIRDGLRQ